MTKQEDHVSISEWRGRYLILVFNCMMVFGIYFFTDMPSALQAQLQQPQTNCSSFNETKSNNCCSDCLGLGADRYNQLYAVHSWTNAVLVFPVGVFVDRMGNRASSLIATISTVIGACLFAASVSTNIRGTNTMFIMMMIGRFFTGAACGSSRIVQDRVLAVWFKDKLALAFGIMVSVLRLGSVLNFLISPHIAAIYGISTALWVGAALCLSCFLSALFLSFLDWYGLKKLKIEDVRSVSSVGALRDIRNFPAPFWLICVMVGTYYCFLNGLISNGSVLLEDTFGYDKTTASNINGVLYDTALILCPISGHIYERYRFRTAFGMERYGFRAAFGTVGGILSIPILPLILYTGVNPIIWYVVLGVCYSLSVISLWPSIALVLPLKNVGTGNGIAALVLHASGGLTSFAIGKILGHFERYKNEKQWLYVSLLLVGYLIIMVLCGIIQNIVDAKHGYMLNRPRRPKRSDSTGSSEREPLLLPHEDDYQAIN